LHLKVAHLLKSGELFCEITPLDPMRIKIPLNERQVRYVAPGERVEFKANAYPGHTFHGNIAGARWCRSRRHARRVFGQALR